MLDLERFNGERFPNCVKSILIASGYETITSLTRINSFEIQAIEEYVKQNCDILKDFQCCANEIYKNQETFRFLPGHRAIIMSIPSQIDSMKQEKAKRSEAKKTPQTKSQPNSMSDNELKSSLVTKCVEYIAKNGVILQEGLLTDSNIIDFERIDDYVKCRFSCPFCDKVISVNYIKYWKSSNVTTHLKAHVMEDVETD